MTTQLQAMGRNSESPFFEVVVDARPYGPPLTSTEQILRAGLAVAFLGLLVVEGWLLWHVLTLWA
ncbi:MAG TPA: hypothetical protein VI701_02020 [Anaerolineales bacterium]|nr:hypothetical protein [Anaerolineales bacterium]